MTLAGMPVARQACVGAFLAGYQLSDGDPGSSEDMQASHQALCGGDLLGRGWEAS